MHSTNAGIDNAIKMQQMFTDQSRFKTKFFLDRSLIALEVDDLKDDTHTLYLFENDGTYKGYKDVYLR